MSTANFPIQQQQYNAEEIDAVLFRFQKMLDKEKKLNTLLKEKKI